MYDRHDPLGYSINLPLKTELLPLGYPMTLLTNSQDVVTAAEELWGGFPQFFFDRPIDMRIIVDDREPGECSTSIALRGHRHLIQLVSDMDTFASCDLSKGIAICWTNQATAANHAWLRYFYLETMVNLMLWHTHLSRIHAGCVALNGRGVLFCGDSGAGKSCLTYACTKRGWTFVSDEAPSVVRGTSERVIIGKPHQIHLRESAFALFPELRGRPAEPNAVGKISFEINTSELPGVATAFRVPIDAVIFLNRAAGEPARLVPLPKEEAWRRLQLDLPLFEEPAHTEHRKSLRNLLEADTFELCYREFKPAIDELERYMARPVLAGAGV